MECMDIAIRAYVRRVEKPITITTPENPPKKQSRKKSDMPSAWSLVFDTETTTDASQKLRFGTYQVRKDIDASNLGKVLAGKRFASAALIIRLTDFLGKLSGHR